MTKPKSKIIQASRNEVLVIKWRSMDGSIHIAETAFIDWSIQDVLIEVLSCNDVLSVHRVDLTGEEKPEDLQNALAEHLVEQGFTRDQLPEYLAQTDAIEDAHHEAQSEILR